MSHQLPTYTIKIQETKGAKNKLHYPTLTKAKESPEDNVLVFLRKNHRSSSNQETEPHGKEERAKDSAFPKEKKPETKRVPTFIFLPTLWFVGSSTNQKSLSLSTKNRWISRCILHAKANYTSSLVVLDVMLPPGSKGNPFLPEALLSSSTRERMLGGGFQTQFIGSIFPLASWAIRWATLFPSLETHHNLIYWKFELRAWMSFEMLKISPLLISFLQVRISSMVRFPKNFCSRICSSIARFWWRSKGKNRDIHWKSWEVLTSNKSEGGLGFKDFTPMNYALLAKQAWRVIQNPNALWVTVLKSLYFPNSVFVRAFFLSKLFLWGLKGSGMSLV